MTPSAIFLDFSARKVMQQAQRISTCLGCLDEEQIWQRASPSSNAIGNLVLHLCGNVRQWIMAGVGGAPDTREREREFSATGFVEQKILRQLIVDYVEPTCELIATLPEHRLTERVAIQGYDVTVMEAIYHVVEHFSGHTGQIIQMTKAITGRRLDFYAHLGSQHAERTP